MPLTSHDVRSSVHAPSQTAAPKIATKRSLARAGRPQAPLETSHPPANAAALETRAPQAGSPLQVASHISTEAPLELSSTYRAKRSEEHTSELQSRENLVCRL